MIGAERRGFMMMACSRGVLIGIALVTACDEVEWCSELGD